MSDKPEETIEIGVEDLQTLIEYAGWAYDQASGREAKRIEEFLNAMRELVGPPEPGPQVEWVALVGNGAHYVSVRCDEDDSDEEDRQRAGWWQKRGNKVVTWEELLAEARKHKMHVSLPGEQIA